jgi:hypothetical protein
MSLPPRQRRPSRTRDALLRRIDRRFTRFVDRTTNIVTGFGEDMDGLRRTIDQLQGVLDEFRADVLRQRGINSEAIAGLIEQLQGLDAYQQQANRRRDEMAGLLKQIAEQLGGSKEVGS